MWRFLFCYIYKINTTLLLQILYYFYGSFFNIDLPNAIEFISRQNKDSLSQFCNRNLKNVGFIMLSFGLWIKWTCSWCSIFHVSCREDFWWYFKKISCQNSCLLSNHVVILTMNLSNRALCNSVPAHGTATVGNRQR